MKTLHLIRHAKSSWEDSRLSDLKRPLSERGKNDCFIMAERIRQLGCEFETVFASPAQRAQLTIRHILNHLNGLETNWQLTDALYTFDSDSLLQWWRSLDDDLSEVVMVGHNPAMTDFICRVSDFELENLPTCAYVQLNHDGPYWRKLRDNSCQMRAFIKPKMFK